MEAADRDKEFVDLDTEAADQDRELVEGKGSAVRDTESSLPGELLQDTVQAVDYHPQSEALLLLKINTRG